MKSINMKTINDIRAGKSDWQHDDDEMPKIRYNQTNVPEDSMEKQKPTPIPAHSKPSRAWLSFVFAPDMKDPEDAVRPWTVMASTMEDAMAEGLAVDKELCGYNPGQPRNLIALIAYDLDDLQELRDRLIPFSRSGTRGVTPCGPRHGPSWPTRTTWHQIGESAPGPGSQRCSDGQLGAS
jgi:hypothetical protein